MTALRGIFVFLVLVTVFAASLSAGGGNVGRAVEGTDRTRIAPPPGALVTPYRNATYRLDVEDDEIVVQVEVSPLQSSEPFVMPNAGRHGSAVETLARSVAAGSRNRYEAVSRVLGWVARNIRYELDRGVSQDAGAVLGRRTAYCTGSARVTVALLRALEIPAREVSGYVVGEQPGDEDGFHRWIEVYYPDRGWVFSDPKVTHNYVPATYVRLGSTLLVPGRGLQGILLERDNQVSAADIHPWAPDGVTARKNSPRQLAGALRVAVDRRQRGTAVLESLDQRRSRPVENGQSVFVGLEPGNYLLEVHLDSGEEFRRRIELGGRIRSSIYLPSERVAEVAPTTPPRAQSPIVDPGKERPIMPLADESLAAADGR